MSDAEREPPKRAIAVAVAVAVTAVMLLLALGLGDWARRTRSLLLHRTRLERLLEKKPREASVVAGLELEGTRAVGVARTEAERVELAARWAAVQRDAVVAEGRRWATTRVFANADVVYILYFDETATLRAFTLIPASR